MAVRIAGDLRLQGFGMNRGKGISIALLIQSLDPSHVFNEVSSISIFCRDLYRKRAGEETESLSQSLFAPLIPYAPVFGRLKGLSGITYGTGIFIAFAMGSLSQSLFMSFDLP